MPLPQSERRTRIAQFGTQWGLQNPRIVKPIDRGLSVTFKLPSDVDAAHGRIDQIQAAKIQSERHGMSKLFTSKPKASNYKPREVTAALLSVVESDGSPGVVEVLVQLLLKNDGDINVTRKSTTKWKRLGKVDQEDVRTGLLATATRIGNINTIRLIIPHTDEASLNESLAIALNANPLSRDFDIIELLLAYGADASLQHGTFMSAVLASARDLAGLLMTAPKSVSTRSMTDALYAAVEAGALEMAFILAKTPADGDDDGGKALKQAVATARPELVTIMTLCNCPPSQSSLDEAVPLIFFDWTTNNTQKRQLLDALLSGGATGSRAASTLLEVTKQCTVQNAASDNPLFTILVCLIRANASLQYEHSAAVKHVVSSNRMDLLDVFLLSGNFTDRLASLGFSSIDLSAPPDLRVSIASKLLAKGASGIPLHEGLIYAVKTDHLDAIKLLLGGNGFSKASVDHREATALKDAVSREKVDVVKLLLANGPKPSSASDAFSCVWNCHKEGRLVLAQDLLDHGATGVSISKGLIMALEDRGPSHDHRLIKLLIRGRADLGFENGRAIELATQFFDMPALDMLLGEKPPPQYLKAAFTSAMSLESAGNRFTACDKLLKSGATGDEVNKALTAAVSHEPNSTSFLKILIPNANINYGGGQALSLAIKSCLPNHTLLLLEQRPNEVSFTNAFDAAMSHTQSADQLKYCRMILEAAVPVSSASLALLKAVRACRDDLCRLMLQHDASPDYEGGACLVTAVHNKDTKILTSLVETNNPKASKNSLEAAFNAALVVTDEPSRLELVHILLDAGVRGDTVDAALISQSKRGDRNIPICALLLNYGASFDAQNGEALDIAAKLGAISLLQIMLHEREFATASLVRAFRSADHQRLDLVKIFINAGLKGKPLHTALAAQAKRGNDGLAVCTLLLTHGASPDKCNGEALTTAAKLGAVPLLRIMLQGRKISGPFLSNAFESGDHRNHELVRLFLDAGLKGEPLNRALAEQAKRGDVSLVVCSMLLKHGATIDEYGGEALDTAVSLGAIQLAQAMLLERKVTSTTISRAFNSALELSEGLRLVMMQLLFDAGLQTGSQIDAGLLKLVHSGLKDVESMKALLEFGASVHHDDHNALYSAARLCHHDVLELLLQYLTDSSATSHVFGERVRESRWESLEMVETLETLLQHGAQGADVQIALVLALSECNTNPLARDFVSILLNHEVDVNFEQGRPFQIAAEIADLDILSIMIAKGAGAKTTTDSLVVAFPYIFKVEPRADETTMLSLIELFREHAGDQLSNSAVQRRIADPPVFISIDIYPESSRVLKAILDAGFSIDQKMYHDLPGLGSVNITPLYWSLAEHEKVVTEPVVYMLLERGASVQGHPTPLLHLAIKKGYSSIVQFLIEAGADVDAANADNETPLLLAYQSGDLDTMKALLTANAELDDGTLHEAARKLDSKAIQLLLEHDHDPNRPSAEHEGRSALAELCFRAPVYAQRASDKNLERDVKKAIKALIKGGARTNIQTKTADDCDKSLLLLTLDSPNPLVMAKALLDCDQWKFVNEDFNLYSDGQYTFSPAMYVEKGIWAGAPQQISAVLNLLKSYQVKRRWWKNEGEQPGDILDAPADIVAAENARKAIVVEKKRKEREKLERLAEMEEEAQAEYERRHKKAELERTLKREDHSAELAEKSRAQDLDLKYQEAQLELEDKRRDGQLRKAQRLMEIQATLKQRITQDDILLLEEERKNIQERAKEGYVAMELLGRAGVGSSGGYTSTGRPQLTGLPNKGNRAIEWEVSEMSDAG